VDQSQTEKGGEKSKNANKAVINQTQNLIEWVGGGTVSIANGEGEEVRKESVAV